MEVFREFNCGSSSLAHTNKLEDRKGSGHKKAGSLTCPPVDATQSDIERNSPLAYPYDVDMCFVGVSGLWSSVVTSDSANAQTPIPYVSSSVHESQIFPQTPLTDEDSRTSCFFAIDRTSHILPGTSSLF